MVDRSAPGIVLPAILIVAVVMAAGAPALARQDVASIMRFASEMAQSGNWREAKYRWEQAQRLAPDDPKILNNLAVSMEVLGDPVEARKLYFRAAEIAGHDETIEDNVTRFAHFWQPILAEADGNSEEPAPELPPMRDGKKLKGKTARVPVGLPVPPKLKLEGDETLLVTSFLTLETNLVDTNRELVRFMRREFRKDTTLDVLDINPPPAIPEQTLDDLLANRQFWQHLGRNYDADLIVSGKVFYDREDASSFQDVDVVSADTGQKVRTSRFVEQEQFRYTIDMFFIDGATGSLRFRDRLQRSLVFQGSQNDPINAFYSLSESLAAEILSVVTLRIRMDSRMIFKK